MEWGATYGRTLVRARPNEHSQRTGPPINADYFPCLRKKPDGTGEDLEMSVRGYALHSVCPQLSFFPFERFFTQLQNDSLKPLEIERVAGRSSRKLPTKETVNKC